MLSGLLAVAVVLGGFYESFMMESRQDWTVVNSLVLLTHCYFNIYTRVSQGWDSYLARRDTSRRLSTLATASPAQLVEHGDLCSICYQDLEHPQAVITNCQHFFHAACLKKWLVVQDNCPLCTKPIVAQEESQPPPDEKQEIVVAEENNSNQVVEEEIEENNGEEKQAEANIDGNDGSGELRFRGNDNRENLFDGD